MSSFDPRSLWLLALLFAAAPCESARAQSVFEGLFGLFGGQQARNAPARVGGGSSAPHETQTWTSELGRADPREAEWDRTPNHDAGSYRTVCVRTCDGYYFPLRGATSRITFRRDADACAQACGSEAKLYYGSRHSSSADDLVDLDGQPYSDMKNAFLYRKTLVDGCACRPMPWSAAERARHLRYAYAEELTRLEERRLASAAAAAESAKTRPDAVPAIAEMPAAGPLQGGQEPIENAGEIITLATRPSMMPVEAAGPPPVAISTRYSPRRTAGGMARPGRRTAHVQKAKTVGPPPFGLFNSGGAPKYRWPGDPAR
ncbi:MAG: DUF2865 domain-containing protein [Hyphomicrobiaceae bacterium]|nr:DUF2865 domain-containing protein [Hyphomicrobiaceae bacterium]